MQDNANNIYEFILGEEAKLAKDDVLPTDKTKYWDYIAKQCFDRVNLPVTAFERYIHYLV